MKFSIPSKTLCAAFFLVAFSGQARAVCYLNLGNGSAHSDQDVKLILAPLVQDYFDESMEMLPPKAINQDVCRLDVDILEDSGDITAISQYKGVELIGTAEGTDVFSLRAAIISSLYYHLTSGKKFLMCRNFGKIASDECASRQNSDSIMAPVSEIPTPIARKPQVKWDFSLDISLGRHFIFDQDKRETAGTEPATETLGTVQSGGEYSIAVSALINRFFETRLRYNYFNASSTNSGNLINSGGQNIQYTKIESLLANSLYLEFAAIFERPDSIFYYTLFAGFGGIEIDSNNAFTDFSLGDSPSLSNFETSGGGAVFGAGVDFGEIDRASAGFGIKYEHLDLKEWIDSSSGEIARDADGAPITPKLSGFSAYLRYRIGF